MAKGPKKTTPEAGGNVAGLSDAQRQALHLSRHVPDYEKALKAKKDAAAAFLVACSVIKADGGNVPQVKLTLLLRTPEGEQAWRDRVTMETEVAAWNGVGVQLDLDVNARQPAEDKAFDDGKRAGLSGASARPPHDPGTKQAQRWLEGHADGQAVLSAGFKPTEQAA
jgi:hypothetical protein